MTISHKLLLLAGDGIGPEVIAEVKKIISVIEGKTNLKFELDEALIGGIAYDETGTPFPAETLEKAKSAKTILLGAVGGPKWESLEYQHRPERGLLAIRKELELFANLRPAICFDALASSSSLKQDIISGLDILIVRELTGGIYFGEPRGVEDIGNGKKRGINSLVYDSDEIRRIGQVAFELTKARNPNGGGYLCSIDKANVLESTELWRNEIIALHQQEYTDIRLEHLYVDNAAMQLVRNPKQFDVIVTTNMFGDIISDCAAMLTGSLGMLPSASLGATLADGSKYALYEPVHGSAPDIAGKGIANPCAMILSFAMALRYSFDAPNYADALENAVKSVLADGIRSADIATTGENTASTAQMGDAIAKKLQEGI